MSNYRTEVSKKNKFYLDKDRTLEMLHFVRQYKTWELAYNSLDGYSKRPADIVPPSRTYDGKSPVERVVEQRDRFKRKMDMIDTAISNTDSVIGPYIFKGIINDLSYDQMSAKDYIPCCRGVFYDLRRQFLWEVSNLRD